MADGQISFVKFKHEQRNRKNKHVKTNYDEHQLDHGSTELPKTNHFSGEHQNI